MTARIGTRREFANTSTCREAFISAKRLVTTILSTLEREREYSKASQRLGAAHLEYLKETELLEDLSRDF
jgi:hypothetical protein